MHCEQTAVRKPHWRLVSKFGTAVLNSQIYEGSGCGEGDLSNSCDYMIGAGSFCKVPGTSPLSFLPSSFPHFRRAVPSRLPFFWACSQRRWKNRPNFI
jgi:hypothetical protein